MVYKPLKISAAPQTGFNTSMMPKAGMNKEDLPQMLDLNFALQLTNYIPYRYGLEKRKGIRAAFERAASFPITLCKEFTSGLWIVGYSTLIEAYNENTGIWTTIKSNFSAGSIFDGTRYGAYFFTCNGKEKIHRIDLTLAISEVVNAPICSGLKVIGPRLYAFNLSSDESSVQYSEVDDGSNPPFTAWSKTTAADTGGSVNYRNAGAVRSVCQQGPYTVVFSDKGFYAFNITTTDSNGTIKKTEVIQNYTEDYGGARGAIETPDGIFYTNEAGLWQMVAVGNTNTPMSKQQILNSTLLGSSYFKNILQTSTDLVFDTNQKIIMVTCAKDSLKNNLIIVYKPELKAMFEFKGWNINRFAKSGDRIMGASSVKTTVYELFTGYDDDGLSIGTEVKQELPLKTLFHAHSLSEVYSGGKLSPSSVLTTELSKYDKQGLYHEGVVSYTWTAESTASGFEAWGSAMWGDSGYGASSETSGLVECFSGGSPRIANMQRCIMKTTSGDKVPHTINWVAFKTTRKSPIKRRNLTLTT